MARRPPLVELRAASTAPGAIPSPARRRPARGRATHDRRRVDRVPRGAGQVRRVRCRSPGPRGGTGTCPGARACRGGGAGPRGGGVRGSGEPGPSTAGPGAAQDPDARLRCRRRREERGGGCAEGFPPPICRTVAGESARSSPGADEARVPGRRRAVSRGAGTGGDVDARMPGARSRVHARARETTSPSSSRGCAASPQVPPPPADRRPHPRRARETEGREVAEEELALRRCRRWAVDSRETRRSRPGRGRLVGANRKGPRGAPARTGRRPLARRARRAVRFHV
jgi:hypothetical protein